MQSMILIASLVLSLVSGCLPCSQLLQQLSSGKSCCTKSGSCKMPKQPAPQKCELTISATEHVVMPDAPQVTPEWNSEAIETSAVVPYAIVASAAATPGYSPPDLFLLNSSILI
jgi:hypothetical protein